MRFLIYTSRKGQVTLTDHSPKAFDFLLRKAERDNRMSIEEAIAQGWDVHGSYEEGRWYMDDGGEIETIFLEDV